MSNEPYYAPNRPPETRTTRPTEHLWAIRLDGRQYDGELLDHGTWGVEFQVLYELEWSYGRRWPTRELALAEADDRKAECLEGRADRMMRSAMANATRVRVGSRREPRHRDAWTS